MTVTSTCDTLTGIRYALMDVIVLAAARAQNPERFSTCAEPKILALRGTTRINNQPRKPPQRPRRNWPPKLTLVSSALKFRTRSEVTLPKLPRPNWDNHLRTSDFFLVQEHPTMTFRSTSLEADGGDFTIDGDLTLAVSPGR